MLEAVCTRMHAYIPIYVLSSVKFSHQCIYMCQIYVCMHMCVYLCEKSVEWWVYRLKSLSTGVYFFILGFDPPRASSSVLSDLSRTHTVNAWHWPEETVSAAEERITNRLQPRYPPPLLPSLIINAPKSSRVLKWEAETFVSPSLLSPPVSLSVFSVFAFSVALLRYIFCGSGPCYPPAIASSSVPLLLTFLCLCIYLWSLSQLSSPLFLQFSLFFISFVFFLQVLFLFAGVASPTVIFSPLDCPAVLLLVCLCMAVYLLFCAFGQCLVSPSVLVSLLRCPCSSSFCFTVRRRAYLISSAFVVRLFC